MLPMSKHLRILFVFAAAGLLASCAQQATKTASRSPLHRIESVRTTAYAPGEDGGRKNAVGSKLSGDRVMSAASDWSRYPLGTRFRIVETKEVYVIDDYGTALVGTNTIDLYKPSRLQMKRWGVRNVDIDILKWGSNEESLKVLAPRKKHLPVQKMIVALQRKASGHSNAPSAD